VHPRDSTQIQGSEKVKKDPHFFEGLVRV